MQKPQPEDENFAESSRSLPHSADQKFVDDKQSAEIGTVADMEFVQTHYSPRGVLLLYFRGEAAAEVDKHFNRTFSELCCLPGSGTSDNGIESSHWQGRPSRPMSERNLPVSFFNPSQTDQSQHLQGTFNHSGKPIHMFQQNHNTITHYNRSCHSTGHPGNYDQNGPNFVRTRGIPVSYAQLPTGVVKSVSPGLAPQVAAQPCRAPAPSFPQEIAVQSSDLQSSSMRFNPRYNSLLVQPNVKPHLPVVPGEPTCTKIDEREKDLEEFPGELLIRRGEN